MYNLILEKTLEYRRNDMLRDAENARMTLEITGRDRKRATTRRVMAVLGRQMIVIGTRLQERYAASEHTASDKWTYNGPATSN